MKAPWSLLPAAPLAVGLTVGIAVQYWGLGNGVWVGVIAALGMAMVIVRHGYVGILLICGAIGWIGMDLHTISAAPGWALNRDISVSAVIKQVTQRNGTYTLVVQIDSLSGPKGARFTPFLCQTRVSEDVLQAQPGQRIHFKATLTPLTPDGVTATPDTIRKDDFDPLSYYSYLYGTGVRAICEQYVSPVRVMGLDEGLLYRMARWRQHLVHLITTSHLPDDAQAFMSALVLGDATLLSPQVKADFRAAGIGHFLALSGMHVGIIAMLLSLALMPLRVLGGKRWQYAAVIVLLWGYGLLTGLGPSVTRACIMGTLIMGAVVVGRQPVPLNSLCVAAVVILMFDPSALFQAGFQLSFAAVWGILVFQQTLNPFSPTRHHTLWQCAQWLTVPLGAMLGTGIITAYWFGRFPVWVIVLNVALSWLMPVVLAVGAVLLVCLICGAQCLWLETVASWLYQCIDVPAAWVASLSWSQVATGTPSLGAVVLYYLWLILFWMILRHRRWWLWVADTVVLAAFILAL